MSIFRNLKDMRFLRTISLFSLAESLRMVPMPNCVVFYCSWAFILLTILFTKEESLIKRLMTFS